MELMLTVDGMTVSIDTAKRTAVVLDTEEPKSYGRLILDKFLEYEGTKEYDGIVSTIQNWYYGSLVKAPWCATAMSYFAGEVGALGLIGGKNENVFRMMNACESTCPGVFYDFDEIPDTIKAGDILFWNWGPNPMTVTSDKHVSVARYDTDSDQIVTIGGNMSDAISTKAYDRKYLYAVYRI